jgi:hypothetical protein
MQRWRTLKYWESAALDTQAMLAQPPWIALAPPYVQEDWHQLSARLRARAAEHWEVWIDWYEARLAGRIPSL